MPIVGDWAGKDLDPKFFRIIWIELGKCTGNAGEWIYFEVIKGFDWKSGVIGEGKLRRIDDWILGTIVYVVFVHLVDLDGWILGINLAFYETLENFWYPNVEADLTGSRNDFEGKVFLDATGIS